MLVICHPLRVYRRADGGKKRPNIWGKRLKAYDVKMAMPVHLGLISDRPRAFRDCDCRQAGTRGHFKPWPARTLANSLRIYLGALATNGFRFRRPERKYAVVQHNHWRGHTA